MKWLRTTLAAIVGVIAVVGVLFTVVGFWAQNTVYDEAKVANAAEAALEEPGVADALATRLTDEVVNAVDLTSIVNDVLPPALQRLTPAIAGGAERLVEEELTKLLANPDVRQTLVASFERAYGAFLDVLKGDGLVDGVSVDHGQVTVNFLPLIGRGVEALQRFGLAGNVTVPELTRDGDPTEQIAALEQATGRDLPDDFGQIVVYSSERLAQQGETLKRVQQFLVVMNRVFVVALIVTVLALVGTVLLAHKRLRTVVILLLASAATFLIARALVNRVLDEAPSVARTAAGHSALDVAFRALAAGLLGALGAGAVVFVITALIVYVLDPNSAVRRRLATQAGDSSLQSAIAANRLVVALGSIAAALLVITIAGFHVLSVIVALLLAALGMYALWLPDAPGLDRSGPPPTEPATAE